MQPTFIITTHDALRAGFHHDLYLEESIRYIAFAIPKGFPTERNVKRLMIRVADHSPDCAHFAGTIESGYGAGVKDIWDEGVYRALKPLSSGPPTPIEFHGSKARGMYFIKHLDGKKWLIWKQ